ncbi:MAG: DUF2834 domain-containing protein [Deltaproteobacteria bacterium]|nr:DUF2834 domain-containing protein [Deltaproteobacteria bacterium]
MKKWIPLLVVVPFTIFSVEVVLKAGPLGFLGLAGREPWGMQMLLDLSIALFINCTWMRRDARERGLPYLPYLLATVLLGSIGTLSYLVHRAFASQPSRALSKAV